MKINKKLCGSSETICKAPNLSFNLFYKYGHAEHIPLIKKTFFEWFVGFFEGIGNLSMNAIKIHSKQKRLYVIITQKEKNIILQLAYLFSFGSIKYVKKKKNIFWQWQIKSKQGLERIALLFFGNLINPTKKYQFLKWIQIGKNHGIFQYPFDLNVNWNSVISLHNGWLSGFIDAKGSFYVNLSIIKMKNRNLNFKQFFFFKQKIKTNLDEKILSKLLFFFKSKSKIEIFYTKKKKKYLSIQMKSQYSKKVLINYILNYKLKTNKYFFFLRWWRLYILKTKTKKKFINITFSKKSLNKIKYLIKKICI